MKRSLLMLVTLFIISLQSWGQEDLKTIELDFKNKKFSKIEELEKIKKGDFYKLKISGVNMNLYKIVFDKKDTIIASNVTFPTFDLVNLGGVSDILAKINSSTLSTNLLAGSTSNLSSALKVKINNNQIYSLSKQDREDIVANLPTTTSLKEKIKARILLEKAVLLSKDNLAKAYKDEINNLFLVIQKKIASYSVLDKDKSYYQLLSGDIKIDDIFNKADDLRRKVKELSEATVNQQTEYAIYIDKADIKKLLESEKALSEDNKNLGEAFSKAISNFDKLSENINTEKILVWLNILVYKENNVIDEYTTLPQQFNGDKCTLSIKLEPQKEEYGLPSYQTELQFPQKKEFYVGIGMSFYNAWFQNEAYSVKATVISDTQTDYQVVNEENKKGELGLTTLIHFGWRPFLKKADWFAINLVTGPALSLTNTVKPRIALGGGFAFGRKNMLTLNGLYMGGYVDKKSNVYNTDDIYSSKPENVTVSKLVGSFAVALGYIYKF